MQSDFFDIVDSRRAVRGFSSDQIPVEVLNRCLDAALKAPSSSNLQPWEFVIVRDPAVRSMANSVCLNQHPAVTAALLVAVVSHVDTWKRNSTEILRNLDVRGVINDEHRRYWGRKMPVLHRVGPLGLFGSGKRMASRLLSLVRPTANMLGQSDLRVVATKGAALAAGTFMLALRAEGFDSCPMEGFDPWRARKLLKLRAGAEVCMFIAVGKRPSKNIGWERILMPRAWMVREI